VRAGVLSQETIEQIHAEIQAEAEAALEQALAEPKPTPVDVYKHTYAPSSVDRVYPEDYTGLPA
jgi:2-oxoisovalerate dehydrogenase E1 component alpha subunit